MGDEWDEPSQRGGFGGNRGYRSQGNGYNDGAGGNFVEVDSGHIGRLIGKGGSRIRELQEQSGAKIDVPRDRGSSTTVQVELSGSEECVARARELINELITSAGSYGDRGQSFGRSGGRGGGGGSGYGYGGGQRSYGGGGGGGSSYGGGQQRSWGGGADGGPTDSVIVDPSMVGRIIGKGGSRIKELQDQSGCRINIPRDRNFGSEVSIELSGDPGAISEAKRLITEITSEDTYRR